MCFLCFFVAASCFSQSGDEETEQFSWRPVLTVSRRFVLAAPLPFGLVWPLRGLGVPLRLVQVAVRPRTTPGVASSTRGLPPQKRYSVHCGRVLHMARIY